MDYGSTHREIVEACKAGDRQAQFDLYRLYSKAMYNVCLRMVRSELDAEDLLQNSFLDVYSKLDSFMYQSSVGAWMKRIVINNCINFLKKKRLDLVDLDDRFHHIQEPEVETLDFKYDVARVNNALMQLPDGYRVVFTMYLIEGYDHKEIGQILNVSEATSKSQYSRAKKKLKMILTERSIY